jgi:hypothetical protein
MRQFPTELIDYTLDFLHSDKKTLRDCSLVCRNWLPVTRFHLFGTLYIDSSSVYSFIELLLPSPLPTIASHVHMLHILFLDDPVFDIIAPYLEDFVCSQLYHH